MNFNEYVNIKKRKHCFQYKNLLNISSSKTNSLKMSISPKKKRLSVTPKANILINKFNENNIHKKRKSFLPPRKNRYSFHNKFQISSLDNQISPSKRNSCGILHKNTEKFFQRYSLNQNNNNDYNYSSNKNINYNFKNLISNPRDSSYKLLENKLKKTIIIMKNEIENNKKKITKRNYQFS